MERQLFDWTNFDIIDDFVFQYYDCDYNGEHVDTIVMDYEAGIMEFYNKEGKVTDTFELIITARKK